MLKITMKSKAKIEDRTCTTQRSMQSKAKEQNSRSWIPVKVPVKISTSKTRIVQMKMNMICSTPLQHSRKRNWDDSDQLGSPIAKVHSADISQIGTSEIKKIKTNDKKSSVSSEQEHKYAAPSYNLVLYSSDEDDIFTIKSAKSSNRKRTILPKIVFSSEVSNIEMCRKSNENIDDLQNVDTNNEHEKLINPEITNINNKANENQDKHSIDKGKMLVEDIKIVKRKYTKRKKKDDLINNVQDINILLNVVNIPRKVSRSNEQNKETTKNLASRDQLDIIVKQSEREINSLNENGIEKSGEKDDNSQSKNTNSKTGLKRKARKINNVDKINKDTLINRQNKKSKETSQESENGARKSARQHVQYQPYWIVKSNSQQISESVDISVQSEQSRRNKTRREPSTNDVVTSTSQTSLELKHEQNNVQKFIEAKQTTLQNTIVSNINKSLESKSGTDDPNTDNGDNINTNLNENLPSTGTSSRSGEIKMVTFDKSISVIPDDDNSPIDKLQSKRNVICEVGKKRKVQPDKINKKSFRPDSNSTTKTKKTTSKLPEFDNPNLKTNNNEDLSLTDSEVNTTVLSDSLIAYFNEYETKSKSNTEIDNIAHVIDKYSFKQIALAQRYMTNVENEKQTKYFGKFPQICQANSNNKDLCIGINIINSNFASGVLEILPSGTKTRESPKRNNMFFFILEGMAEVSIGNVSKILRIGDSFYVPNTTPYHILNLNKFKRLLILFTKQSAT